MAVSNFPLLAFHLVINCSPTVKALDSFPSDFSYETVTWEAFELTISHYRCCSLIVILIVSELSIEMLGVLSCTSKVTFEEFTISTPETQVLMIRVTSEHLLTTMDLNFGSIFNETLLEFSKKTPCFISSYPALNSMF